MKSGIRQAILNLKKGIVVPALTPITVGMEVLRIPSIDHAAYSFGLATEDTGTVESIKPFKIGSGETLIAIVLWTCGIRSEEYVTNLLATTDYSTWLITNEKQSLGALYHVDQIVFVRPLPGQRSSSEWPAVGSPYETDIKIIEVHSSRFGSVIKYKAYIPYVGYRNFNQESLMTAKEKERIVHDDFKEYFVNEDSLPFFKKGERVKVYGGYVYNMNETVIIEITDEIRKLLSWSIKQEPMDLLYKEQLDLK